MTRCVVCGKASSPDCRACQERQHTKTALRLFVDAKSTPYPNHVPVWDGPEEKSMSCANCGMAIPPGMTMRELFAPCSKGVVA